MSEVGTYRHAFEIAEAVRRNLPHKIFREGVERAAALASLANASRGEAAIIDAITEVFHRYEFSAEVTDEQALIRVL